MKLSRSTASAPSDRLLGRPGRRGFSLIELLVTIAIMGIIASLLVGVGPAAMRRARESRIRSELNALEAQIESYKAKYGVYPPDGIRLRANGEPERDAVGNLVVLPAQNPLFYELTGVIVRNPTDRNGYFEPLGDREGGNQTPRLLPADLKGFFGRDGFVNAAPAERQRSLFKAEFKESASAEIYKTRSAGQPDIHVLAVGWVGDAERPRQNAGIPWPANHPNFPPPIPGNPRLNPWRYVSSNPTNNPGRYDLWAEYIDGSQKRIIGNWRN